MLVEYKKKWFNPEHVSGITCQKIYHTASTQTVKIYTAMISGSNIEIESSRLNDDLLAQEFIEKSYSELSAFINKHCKEIKCKN